MKRILLIGASAVALAGCEGGDFFGLGTPTSPAFAVTSTTELIALGAIRLEDDALTQELSGATLFEPEQGWTWEIREDGTQSASADDGSWEDSPGTWEISNGQFCRENEDITRRCSEVYRLGDYYRFTLPDGALANWTVARAS